MLTRQEVPAENVAMEMSVISYTAHEEEEDILRASTARQRYPQLFDWLKTLEGVSRCVLYSGYIPVVNITEGIFLS